MPQRKVNYDVPFFEATGNADVDRVLNDWRSQMSETYSANAMGDEQLPYVVSSTHSAASDPAKFPLRINNTFKTVAEARMTIRGGTVVVFGDVKVKSSAAGIIRTAELKLVVTYPNGTQESLKGAKNNGSTFNINRSWRVEPRFQTGGDHSFSLEASAPAGAGSTVVASEATFVIQVL